MDKKTNVPEKGISKVQQEENAELIEEQATWGNTTLEMNPQKENVAVSVKAKHRVRPKGIHTNVKHVKM